MTEQALAEFREVFDDGWLANEGPWTGLTCREANAFAGLLRAIGLPEAARSLLAKHATDDDESDEHYQTGA